MGEIDSEIGGREFQSVSNRRFTVPDESGYSNQEPQYNSPQERLAAAQRLAAGVDQNVIPEQPQRQQPQRHLTENEIMEARRQRSLNMNRASEHARRRIEYLTGIGRTTQDVTIDLGDNTITTISLRSLKSREIRALVKLANVLSQQQNTDVVYAVRERTLAYAIYAIDGASIDMVLGVEGFSEEEKLMAREEFLDELDEGLINYIYTQYQNLVKENSKKYGIETEDDAKEVASQARKSSQGE